ncbi:MAG: phosphoribosylglycinamide formyltransferase [Actinomycetota bacterium]|nr:phosphoribosylglycinamide formyltransferase [Actinomycetota bacterium]
MAPRILVLASGSGTLLQALLDSPLARLMVAVGTDRGDAEALVRASAHGVATFIVDPANFSARTDWDSALLDAVAAHDPDLVVSAGFMRILGPEFVAEFSGRIINTHPALLPSFPGAHAVRDVIAAGVTETGCTVHYIDEGVDTGPIIAQLRVEIMPGDDETTLHERIKVAERTLLISVITELIGARSE